MGDAKLTRRALLGTAALRRLDRRGLERLDEVVRFTEADLMESSSGTRDHVATGMTLRDACDAAILRD